jgi:hypothetical protein
MTRKLARIPTGWLLPGDAPVNEGDVYGYLDHNGSVLAPAVLAGVSALMAAQRPDLVGV